ncbi:MAG TPA: hypothetical protein VIV34_05605, partial [Pseudolabrys sp.]
MHRGSNESQYVYACLTLIKRLSLRRAKNKSEGVMIMIAHQRKAALLAMIAAVGLYCSGQAARAQQNVVDCTKLLADVTYFQNLRNNMTEGDLADLGADRARREESATISAARRNLVDAVKRAHPDFQVRSPSPDREWAAYISAVVVAEKDPSLAATLKQAQDQEWRATFDYREAIREIREKRFARQISDAYRAYYKCVEEQKAAQREAERQARIEQRKNMTEEERQKELDQARLFLVMTLLLEGGSLDEVPLIAIGPMGDQPSKVAEPAKKLTKTQKETIRRLRKR